MRAKTSDTLMVMMMMMPDLDASFANHFWIPKGPRQCNHPMLGDLVRDAEKGEMLPNDLIERSH